MVQALHDPGYFHVMSDPLTASDFWPLILKLHHDERVRLAKLALRAAATDDASAAAFVVLATDASSDRTDVIIRRVQELVVEYNSSKPPPPFALAISIGSTIYDPAAPETIEDILKRADKMMYEQKARRKASAASTTGEAPTTESPK